jgi:hypothetical protein
VFTAPVCAARIGGPAKIILIGRNGFESGWKNWPGVGEFADVYRDGSTIDNLLLHPREAVLICDDVRQKHRLYDLPDDRVL